MITYNMDARGNLSLYEHLYRLIREDILSGNLHANEKLPSKRKLAAHLSVSVITIQTAYEQLVDEGYLYAEYKKGYFVSPLEQRLSPQQPSVRITSPNPEIWALDLSSTALSSEQFPFSVWSRLMRQVLAEEDKKLLTPTSYQGAMELREAIASYLGSFRGLHVSPEQIIVGAGTEYLYMLLFQFFGLKSTYAVEDPGYSRLADIISTGGGVCRYLPLDGNGLSIKALQKSDADILHITPAHHFPTGTIMPLNRRMEILRWADSSPRRYIIEDEYDSEFRFAGRPLPTLSGIDRGEKVIYMNTFTKSVAPSVRISYMVLPPTLYKQFHQKLSFYSCPVSLFEQHTLARFLSGGYFERHLSRMRTYYRGQRDLFLDALTHCPLSSHLSVSGEDTGLHFILHMKTVIPEKELQKCFRKRGIRVAMLSDYYHEATPLSHRLVISYAGADPKIFKDLLRDVCKDLISEKN